MDKDLKKAIDETLNKFFENAPEKMVEKKERSVYYDVCPHCKQEIYEKHEYTEDGGLTWRHSDCKGLIKRPDTPLEEIADWLRPYAEEARKLKKEARKALGLDEDLPPSGEEKYSKQEPGGTFGTANVDGMMEE